MSNIVPMAGLFQHKMSHAKRLIDIHNYLRSPSPEGNRVVYEDFIQKLVAIGGSSDEMLKEVTADDLMEIGLPVLMARRLAEIFQAEPKDLDFEVSPHGAVICKGGNSGSVQR